MKNLDQWIAKYLKSNECQSLVEKASDFNPPVTLTYALERLVVTHVKLFMLEDQVRNPDFSDEQIGVLKRRIDHWNGVVRPRLVAGLGEILAKAIREQDDTLVREPNNKDYKVR